MTNNVQTRQARPSAPALARRRGVALRGPTATIVLIGLLLAGVFLVDPAYSAVIRLAVLMGAVAISFQIVYGILGELSLGHAALFGVGAYSYAVLAKHGQSMVLAMVVAGVLGLVVGAAVAAVTIRLSQAYFAVATFAIASLAAVVVSTTGFLGRDEGIIGVPAFPLIPGLKLPQTQLLYAGITFLVVLAAFVAFRRSRTGLALETVRADPSLAKMLGVNVALARVVATGASGLLAGLVGGVFAQQARFVSPDVFGVYYVITPLAIVAIGGLRSALASVVGAVVVVVVPQSLGFSAIADQIFSAAVLFLVVLLMPRGVVGGLVTLWQRLRHRKATAIEVPFDLPEVPIDDADAEPGTEIAFRAEAITVRFGALVAVSDVSLSIRAGEVLGLIGANGAGKSTFVNAVSGLVRATGGRVWLGDVEITKLSPYHRARAGLSRTFQQVLIADDLTVRENMRVAAGQGRFVTAHADHAEIESVARQCGLAELLSTPAASLTYMHRRLLTIAMALVPRPKVIFLDEATAGLSDLERDGIAKVVVGIARSRNTAFLVIEHDVGFVTEVSDRIAVMDRGALIAEGDAETVLKHEDVVRSYLGTS